MNAKAKYYEILRELIYQSMVITLNIFESILRAQLLFK